MEKRAFWLTDKTVPDQFKKTYKHVVRDKATRNALGHVITTLHRLVDISGPYSELQDAVFKSLAEGRDVVECLRERQTDLLSQIEVVEVETRAYEKQCFARHAEVQPVITEAVAELFRLTDEVKALESKIRGFEPSRATCLSKYEAAGLSQADVEAVGGIKPTLGDLAEWKVQLQEKKAREDQIGKFLRSAPDFDLSTLEPVHVQQDGV